MVAHDTTGRVCNAWTKNVSVDDLEITEASTILCALRFAKLDNLSKIVVESDSKVCIDTITRNPEDPNWKISIICAYVNMLALEFVSCCFYWVKRDANVTAHELAKFVIHLDSNFNCNGTSLTTFVKEAWQRDVLGLSLFPL